MANRLFLVVISGAKIGIGPIWGQRQEFCHQTWAISGILVTPTIVTSCFKILFQARLLSAAGWHVCDYGAHDISRPCAIREFPLKSGHGFADYLLYLKGKAVGVIEAKKVGHTLKGIETQSAKYTTGLPDELPAWEQPLPFAYESTARKPSSPTIWIPNHGPAALSRFTSQKASSTYSISPMTR
jgi:type I site-specific restriction endonuclease